MLMSRTIAAYEGRTPFFVRAVGANPGCRQSLHTCARSTREGVGGRRPAFGSDGSAPAQATAARLAPLITTPVERSASGDYETAPSRPHWAAGRWAARPQGRGTGTGAKSVLMRLVQLGLPGAWSDWGHCNSGVPMSCGSI
jgi:hypothetical protein